jgi:O-antigen ligase
VSVPAAPTERPPALGVAPPLTPVGGRGRAPRRGLLGLPVGASAADPALRAVRPGGGPALWWTTLLTAGIVCFVTFYAKGGLNLESMTTTEMALTLGAGFIVACAVVLTPAGRRAYGLWPVGLLLAFTALTTLSVVWSVQPDDSFKDAGRMLAYSGVFGAAVALVRLAPDRWPAILGGLTLAAVIVCGYALLTKVFPGKLVPANSYARLEEPYGYWNALGLTAAIGAICCMWLGARRAGHALASALAYPAMGLLLVTLMLAYSRGALVALAIGLALWLCLVPLRLRGAAVLIAGALGAGVVVAWDFSTHALSADNLALGERATAGRQLGVLLVAMVLLLTLAGLAIGFLTGRRAPSHVARRNAGTVLLALIVLAVLAFAGALAHSHRGLTGSISHAVDALTNPNAKPPPNTPGRLTAVASVRARYWNEALEIFAAHPALGAGAAGYETARLRYRTATLKVKQAHGFVVQTLADLGLVGLALALALLAAWMAAAGRATHPFNRQWTSWHALPSAPDLASPARRALRGRGWLAGWRQAGWRRTPAPYTPERIGMLSMLCLVVVFGAHSLVDWTWYVPGNACVALLCAGWLAGRGPLSADPGSGPSRGSSAPPPAGAPTPGEAAKASGEPSRPRFLRELGPVGTGVAVAAIIAALLAAWSQWQPQRSVDASQQALALLARDPNGALSAAQAGVTRDPLSVQALFTLSTIERAAAAKQSGIAPGGAGQSPLARATLQQAVRLQPSNPETWVHLGEYDLPSDPRSALNELRAAIYLNPESIAPEAIVKGNEESIAIQNDYIQALRATTPPPAAVKSATVARGPAATVAHREAGRRHSPPRSRNRNPRAGA